jgi:hypothetical protein
MRIIRKFKQLTSFTYPFGTESDLEKYLPIGYQKDEWGNYYFQIGVESRVMFTCHLDTSCIVQEKVNHIFDGDFIKTDETTILGADDKAGMTVMLYMIDQKVPGLYYFFIGEERGCVGSSKLAKNWKDTEFYNKIDKVISFDRRGTDSIITEQLYGVCCSDEFANELSERLNYANQDFKFKPDPTGIYTDSAQFTDIIPECTNISVGYYNEHSTSEYQNINFLKKLCFAVCEIDWESLPVKRFQVNYDDQIEEFLEQEPEDKVEIDENPEFYNYFDEPKMIDERWSGGYKSYFNSNGTETLMHISDERVSEESDLIKDWISKTNDKKIIYFFGYSLINEEIYWDGDILYLVDKIGSGYVGHFTYLSNRSELSNLIPALRFVHKDHLRIDVPYRS